MTEHTWTILELLWTFAHAVGVLANIRLLGKALEKREAVRDGEDCATRDAELLSAGRYIRNDGTRLLFFGAGCLVGFWAMAVPDGDPLLAYVTGAVLVFMAFTPLACSLWDLTDEPAMDRILEREAQERAALDEDRLGPSTNSILRELQERRRLRLARERKGGSDGPAD